MSAGIKGWPSGRFGYRAANVPPLRPPWMLVHHDLADWTDREVAQAVRSPNYRIGAGRSTRDVTAEATRRNLT